MNARDRKRREKRLNARRRTFGKRAAAQFLFVATGEKQPAHRSGKRMMEIWREIVHGPIGEQSMFRVTPGSAAVRKTWGRW